MPYTKASGKAVDKYCKKNYDKFLFRVKKGEKDELQTAATKSGESLNAFILRAVRAQIERESPQTELSELDS